MAKVTQPLGSSEARGSVGGFTFNTWRGIHTVKTRSGPKDEPSQLMLDMLALAAAATADWKGKPQLQRDAWNAWAAKRREPFWTGQDKRLTGYNWYLRLYVRRCLIGIFEDQPPSEHTIDRVISGLYTSAGATGFDLAWDIPTWPDVAEYYVEVYLTHPLSAGRMATIHDAFRYGANPASAGIMEIEPLAEGTYTAFARLLHITGLVTPFLSTRVTIPP